MKILITERQLRKIISEQVKPHVSDSISVINYALDSGLDLKPFASKVNYRVKWSDVTKKPEVLEILPEKFREYVPEIVSGVKEGFEFDTRLIDILKEIESISGLDLLITGGRDYFHLPNNPNSKHNIGKAVDFIPINGMNDINDSKIESAVLDIILSGKYADGIGLINERIYRSGHASGDHFHLSLDESNVEYSNFAYIDLNGKVYDQSVGKRGVNKTIQNLMWGNGGPLPKTIDSKINEKLFKPLIDVKTYMEYCEVFLDLNDKHPNKIKDLSQEYLLRNLSFNDTFKYCKEMKEPKANLPTTPVELIPNEIKIDIERDQYRDKLYKELPKLSKKELRQKIKQLEDDGREDLIPMVKYHL